MIHLASLSAFCMDVLTAALQLARAPQPTAADLAELAAVETVGDCIYAGGWDS